METTPVPEIRDLVDQVINRYKEDPVNVMGIEDAVGEYNYVAGHRFSYERTVQDIVDHFQNKPRGEIRILEIGTFLGVVSVALSKLGFDLTATDIEEFISSPNLQRIFRDNHIEYKSCNLSDYKLPFGDEKYDAVIMCETLEHLNFNPLPVIKEINRVLKSNGLFYLTLPNIASSANRKKLLAGKSIHNPIQDFFAQLDAEKNMIVGLHWREYTTEEIKEMLNAMGFEVIHQKYEGLSKSLSIKAQLRKIITKIVFRVINLPIIKGIVYDSLVDPDDPALKQGQINFALKKASYDKLFHFTNVTSNKKTL